MTLVMPAAVLVCTMVSMAAWSLKVLPAPVMLRVDHSVLVGGVLKPMVPLPPAPTEMAAMAGVMLARTSPPHNAVTSFAHFDTIELWNSSIFITNQIRGRDKRATLLVDPWNTPYV